MQINIKFWLKFSLINLLIVAFLGLLMRYKIGFEFPVFNQKNIQHSHSHFAFAGWISHTLMVLMIGFLNSKITINSKRYIAIIIVNLVCAYGMLISFFASGYSLYSIFFSTLSIFVSYYFGYFFIKDLKLLDQKNLSLNWFKMAVFFLVISSFGTFYLAYMMMSKNIYQNEYLASIYYYLHFQYNGWFFFACMGLLFSFLKVTSENNPFLKQISKLFFVSCIPAYFLSTLWLDLPDWIYYLTILAAITQTFAWFKFIKILSKTKFVEIRYYPALLRYILCFIGIAVSIKILLQLFSIIPSLSQLAFGFRPIVIAYLHLVLLAIISLFLLFYIYINHFFYITKSLKFGILIFTVGIILNELLLAIQGITSIYYIVIPYVNEMLFGAAIVLFSGISITCFYSIKKMKYNAVL